MAVGSAGSAHTSRYPSVKHGAFHGRVRRWLDTGAVGPARYAHSHRLWPGFSRTHIQRSGFAGADYTGPAGLRGTQLRALSLSATLIRCTQDGARSEEHTSELQSLMRISYAVFCLKKKKKKHTNTTTNNHTTEPTKTRQQKNITT